MVGATIRCCPRRRPFAAHQQEEIGNLAGVSRQRVNQPLPRLEKDALLAIEYGGIRIIDLERLRNLEA